MLPVVSDLPPRKSPATSNESIIPRTHSFRQIYRHVSLNIGTEVFCDSSSVGGWKYFCFLYREYFLFKEEVSFWSWEILSDKNHQLKTCHYKRGISQYSFQKTVAIHFWKWFIAKESLAGVGGALIFRRQPALWEVSENLREGSHVPCWPHRSSLNHRASRWHAMTNFLL